MADLKTWKGKISGVTITIDYDECDGCDEDADCVTSCPITVLEMVDGKATAPNVEECTEYGLCVSICPWQAITVSSSEEKQ